VPVDDFRPLVPRCFSIDTYHGIARVGSIPFAVEAARPLGAPPELSLRFLATNVRTYVRLDGAEPGVFVFFWTRLHCWPLSAPEAFSVCRTSGLLVTSMYVSASGLPAAATGRYAAVLSRAL
jgi:uncharacterized protein YqjF (DUF2071 family)